MGTSRNVFSAVLSIMVLAITLLALLGIWDVIDWSYVQKYFWKSVQSLIVLLISAVVIYLIQQMFRKEPTSAERTRG
ncbi:MAG: hypothetical protein ACOVMR_05610 [Flavobacteriales bacterium]|jgi:hypothetical protein